MELASIAFAAVTGWATYPALKRALSGSHAVSTPLPVTTGFGPLAAEPQLAVDQTGERRRVHHEPI